jgi:hypothetical protein
MKRMKKLWQLLRREVFNKDNFLWFLIAESIFWSPCIITAIFALCYDPWFWSAFGAYIVFWGGPLTPAIMLQAGLALLLKKLFGRKHDGNV